MTTMANWRRALSRPFAMDSRVSMIKPTHNSIQALFTSSLDTFRYNRRYR